MDQEMNVSQSWQRCSKDMTAMPPLRQRGAAKKPMWIIVLLLLVCVALMGAYVYPPRRYSACYFFASSVCTPFKDWLPAVAQRERTDEEIISSVVIKDLLSMPMPVSKNPKIAFMFLTPGSLPFEKLWEKFLQVVWGRISMVDAEKRLLANALEDVDNQFFVLLSDSFLDPGPHGSGRYSPEMFPEIEQRDFRKGAQWFAITRRHALLILADNLYYDKFKLYCKPAEGRNCIADEHYLPTLFNMVDPGGISNWSVTHVDWSEGKWHPRSYRAADVTNELLKNITSVKETFHVTSDDKVLVQAQIEEAEDLRGSCLEC
ncbi:hypothetical protein PR202_gb06374 [Eleusine coracana subsp. coracana]|uniref:Nucleotide-diphospho-sugar transferase domain-containing protein n=1 Tax=Eleusine coracana subsp. coracana TaxID=191504 RepID=A0AAV5E7P1_ELECO|nr:hypothetical protein PR202_gb06374 [Eleusine coracana subsp. coracana]